MKRRRLLRYAAFVLGSLILALSWISPAAAQRMTADLSKPLILVATPSLDGDFYERAVLIVVSLDDQHRGFMLNRATHVSMAKAFPDHPPSVKVIDPIYLGGPEMDGALFALLRHDPGKPSVRLLDGVYMTKNAGKIDEIIEKTPNEARYLAGFVEWAPGELAAELKKGLWQTLDADASTVFRKPDGMWEELVKKAEFKANGI